MMVFPFDCLYFGYAAAKWPSSSSAWNIHIKHSTDFPFVFASPNANNSIRASIIHHFLCLVVLHVESSGFYTALFFIHTHTHTGHKCLTYVKNVNLHIRHLPFLLRFFILQWSYTIVQCTEYKCEHCVWYGRFMFRFRLFSMRLPFGLNVRRSWFDMNFMQIIANKFFGFD